MSLHILSLLLHIFCVSAHVFLVLWYHLKLKCKAHHLSPTHPPL